MFSIIISPQHKSINVRRGCGLPGRLAVDTVLANQQLLPPINTYRFDKCADAPIKSFAYLAARQEIPDYEVISLYNEFAFDLRSNIKNITKLLFWENVGRFYRDDTGGCF